ncbi:MAG: hypothetical protein ISR85_02045 [Kiritimatiellales bacterium]|nr:hypothetical protein [Kiritimatiellota bacterium]MBL7011696.1 hypothetical protein [Kiritimatiellales bacterium]
MTPPMDHPIHNEKRFGPQEAGGGPFALDAARAKFKDAPIPRPCSWGGLRLIPERFEFWQGRVSRLHDRVVFERNNTAWRICRLAP